MAKTPTQSTHALRRIVSQIGVLIIMFALFGCKGRVLEPAQRTELAQRQAHAAGLDWSARDVGIFKIATAMRRANHSERIHVYIEGDGLAWKSRSRRSADPTPRRPMSLELAIKDMHPSVMYIGRPCQYLSAADLANCSPKYWTSHRYSKEIVTAIHRLLDEISAPLGGKPRPRFILIGYSGGGTLATLLTAARRDIDGLITVAANLDHRRWTSFHDVSPLHGSVSIDADLPRLATVRQCHLFGQQDTIVPPHLADAVLSRVAAIASPGIVQWSTVENFEHDCCWAEIWPKPLRQCMSN